MINLLTPNTVLHGRYRIARVLGQGGMGAVYLAGDQNLPGLAVAIKENFDSSQGAQDQFQREAVILARLRHSNLPQVTDHFIEPPGRQYLVMDYVEGEELEQMVQQRGPLPESAILTWASQLLDALEYMHTWVDSSTGRRTPVIHRDIKPANIKITSTGQAMLIDFGIAKADAGRQATVTAARAITPGFSPPEQYGLGATDERSDIYALGCTVYYLLTGVAPPEAPRRAAGGSALISPRHLNPRISPNVENAILRAVELSPPKRFQTAAEFRRALQQISVGPPIAQRTARARGLWRYPVAFLLSLLSSLAGLLISLVPASGWGIAVAWLYGLPEASRSDLPGSWRALFGTTASQGLIMALGIVLLLLITAGVVLSLYWIWRLPFVSMYYGARLGFGEPVTAAQVYAATAHHRDILANGLKGLFGAAIMVGVATYLGTHDGLAAVLAGFLSGWIAASLLVTGVAAR